MIYAFLSAFFTSFKDLFGKRATQDLDEYVVALALRVFSLLVLLPFFLWSGSIREFELSRDFILILILNGSLNVVSTVLYFRAIRLADISLVVPLIAFTPVFLLVTTPLMLGESPSSLVGFLGVILVALGAYIMNLKEWKRGIFIPIQAIVRERGARAMLMVAVIWSVTSNFDKIGVGYSSPLLWVIAIDTFIALVMFCIVLWRSRGRFEGVRKNFLNLFGVGASEGISMLFQMIAVSLTVVPFVIAMKRTSILWSALWGFIFFREKGIKEKLVGIVLMLIGVACILLWR